MLINTAGIALPADWKEPQNGRYWAFAAIGAAAQVQVPVFVRSELEELATAFLPNPHLIYTQDAGGFQVGLYPPNVAAAAWVISVYYFAYPAVLVADADMTGLLTFYPNLILSKTLSLIFQSVNDPIWQQHEQAWQQELQRVTGVDIGASNAAPRPDKE